MPRCPKCGMHSYHCKYSTPTAALTGESRATPVVVDLPEVAAALDEVSAKRIAGLEESNALLRRIIDDEKPMLQGILDKIELAELRCGNDQHESKELMREVIVELAAALKARSK